MKRMKGFLVTILSIGIVMILVVLAVSLRASQLSMERSLIEPLPLTYAAALLDDVAYEVNSIVGPEIEITEQNDSVRVSIIDEIHSYNHTPELSVYSSFLTGDVADRTASSITTNFTNMTNGTITLLINEEYNYTNDHNDNEVTFTKAGGTGATAYDIDLTVTAVRSEATSMAFDGNGTINVTIRYTDLNGTNVENGVVSPDSQHTLRIGYADGSEVKVTIGPQNGNDGSLKIESNGIEADTSWSVVLPPLGPTKKLGYEYDATIAYTQGRVAKQGRIGK